jgi:hypothetical protein
MVPISVTSRPQPIPAKMLSSSLGAGTRLRQIDDLAGSKSGWSRNIGNFL